MGAQKIVEFLGRGEARLYGSADNVEYVGHRAPATVTAQWNVTWPAAAPAGPMLMQVSAAGVISFVAAGGGTLDQSYDFGGAGVGRTIDADTGAVEVQGADGILINTSGDAARAKLRIQAPAALDASIEFVEDATQRFEFGYDQSRGGLLIGLGDFTTPAFFMEDVTADIGINETTPDARLHITDSAQTNLVVERTGSAICRIALRDSVTGGIGVVGIQANTDDLQLLAGSAVLFHADGTLGFIGIGELVPDAMLHVTAAGALVGLFESAVGSARIGLRDSASSDENQVGIIAVGDDMRLQAGGADLIHLDATDARVGIGVTIPNAKLEVVESGNLEALNIVKSGAAAGTAASIINAGTGLGLLLGQTGNGIAFDIDSEATGQVLIRLQPLLANTRGDVNWSATRTADPSGPTEGDMWYDSTNHVMKYYDGTVTQSF